jgi:hypothetical protein
MQAQIPLPQTLGKLPWPKHHGDYTADDMRQQ